MLRAFQSASAARTAEKTAGHSRSCPFSKIKNAARSSIKPVFFFLAMFLLMRAEAFNQICPLAPAFLSAALSCGIHPAVLCAGCMAGMLRLPLHSSALIPAIACGLTLAGELAFSFVRRRPPSAEARCAAVSGISVMLPALFFASGAPLPSLQAIAAGAIAASSAPFFLAALKIEGKRKRLSLPEKTGLFLLLAAIIGGIQAILPAASGAASVFSVLILSPVGASAGVICGLGRILGGAGADSIAAAALSGFASGWKIYRTRWQRSVCVAAVSVLIVLTTGQAPAEALACMLAALAYAFVPGRLPEIASALFSCSGAADTGRIAKEICAESRIRLTAMAEAFDEMALSCAEEDVLPDEQALIGEMRSRLCSGCAEYPACWNGSDNCAAHFLCALIGEALERVDAPAGMRVIYSDGEIPPEIMRFCRRGRMIPDRLGLLLRDFAEKRRSVIKRCMNNRCLSAQYAQAKELLCALASRQSLPLQPLCDRLNRLEAALEAAQIQGCEASASDEREIRLTRNQGEWTNDEVSQAAQAIAQVFGGRFMHCRRGSTLYFTQRPRFDYRAGVSCCAGKAGHTCGDSHLVRMLGPSCLAVILSDGMGSGEKACRESSEALKLMWRFLRAGIARPLAIETVNRHMLMRTGDEIYATADIAIIDLNTGTAEFSKFAACPTLIFRDGQTLCVEGGSLPLGILEKIQAPAKNVRLKSGDTLIFASDGVTEAFDISSIGAFLREHGGASPETLAEILVREAALRRSQSRSDDMTCICIRIEEFRRHRKNHAAAQ